MEERENEEEAMVFRVLLRVWPAYLCLYRDMYRSVSYLEQLG